MSPAYNITNIRKKYNEFNFLASSQFIHGKQKSILHNNTKPYSSDISQSQRLYMFDLVDVSPTSTIFPKPYHTTQQPFQSTQTDKANINFNASFINKHRFQHIEPNSESIDSINPCREQGSVSETTKEIYSTHTISCLKDYTISTTKTTTERGEK